MPEVAYLRPASDDDVFQPIPHRLRLQEPPRREWLIEKCFTKGSVALVAGDGGIGKSLLLQQMLTAACLGLPWLGLQTAPGRGLFFACEDDDDELRRRERSICRALNRDVEDVLEGGLDIFGRVSRDNVLSRLDRKSWSMEPTELFARVAKYARDHGVTYIVIDTATQTFAGNQNDEQQVSQFINQMRQLAILIQGVVILTKHPSLSGRASGTGESGNTAWHNSVRSRLYLHNHKTKGLVLESRKSNYSRSDLSIPLKWESGAYKVCEILPQQDYADYD